jgi:hypothetical protein
MPSVVLSLLILGFTVTDEDWLLLTTGIPVANLSTTPVIASAALAHAAAISPERCWRRRHIGGRGVRSENHRAAS